MSEGSISRKIGRIVKIGREFGSGGVTCGSGGGGIEKPRKTVYLLLFYEILILPGQTGHSTKTLAYIFPCRLFVRMSALGDRNRIVEVQNVHT